MKPCHPPVRPSLHPARGLLREALVALMTLTALALPATALAAPASRAAAALPALAPVPGEVIVRFRADAAVLSQAPLPAPSQAASAGRRDGTSGRDSAAYRAAVAGVLDRRAAWLAQRHGRSLLGGPALGERTQIVRAGGADAAALARALAADPAVEFAEANGRRRILNNAGALPPDDPLFAATAPGVRPRGPDAGQWYLRAPEAASGVGAPRAVVSGADLVGAWATTTGSPNMVVAVLDTGVRFEHPDLGRVADGGRLLPGHDFVTDAVVANDGDGRDADPTDPGDWLTSAEAGTSRFSGCEASNSSWHGTGTASLVGAATNDGVGMAGAAPGVRVLPIRVLGKCFGTDADIQAGMRWAAGVRVAGLPDNPTPARVLNMSLGASGPCTASYQAAVDEVLATGAVIVAAAGNSAGGAVGAPGNCRGVIAVLALRHAGTKVGFSDLGPEIGIAAPGGNCIDIGPGDACVFPIIAATDVGARQPAGSAWTDSFDITVGTSFSSPLVAAAVALLRSHRPGLDGPLVMSALASSARPFPTAGADNGDDPAPVLQCAPPSANVEQLQCYCNTAQCGAGMLDAAAALRAADGTLARVTVVTPTPAAGAALQLSAANSPVAAGRQIVAWRWELLGGSNVASGFTSATNAATASLQPTSAGTVRVRLSVTDSAGQVGTVVQAIGVGPVGSGTPPATGGGGGGGGGGLGLGWLLLLGAAVMGLRRADGRADGLKDGR